MKSPDELQRKLQRQWLQGELRQRRLLEQQQWPLHLTIGKPSPLMMRQHIAAVREHIQRWRSVLVGEVDWQPVSYRSTAEPVELPISWVVHSADEWIAALADESIRQEYRLINSIMAHTDPLYHPMLIRQRQQVLTKGAEETILACKVASQLQAGYAAGKPLRALSVDGCDSKFFQRHRNLLGKLLELRFGQQVMEQGLEQFLGALDESEHWLLVVPLETGLLPFQQLRLRSSELAQTPLPGTHLLIIENERSLYQLPTLPGTVAILGAGLNLGWMKAAWINKKHIAYWGDIDTWGMTMLARARANQPTLTPLLMDQETFSNFSEKNAVAEPISAGEAVPAILTEPESNLYRQLYQLERGRLEQEFIPLAMTENSITRWHFVTDSASNSG
ncbi:MAG: hypothetical protein KZQ94_08640 [Candidatus Thiodiazotropha sp. (ex Troendleina suluensis)]|nr:hypothetical protein [Candidatus Thiodiazotropha sp. (ex Troendleina suluensis)]